MKKTIIFIVVAVLAFSLLTSCSNENNPTNNNKGGNALSTSQIDVSNISRFTEFSNGRAFLKYKDDANTYCIDKTGKVLFSLEGCNINNFAKFNGKLAMIETSSYQEYILCDEKGKIYKAEDFGASRIVLEQDIHKQAFLDGYIIMERREESYTGTKIELCVLDSDLNTLVPFSSDLNVNGYDYYDGYIFYLDNTFLDLRTGKLVTDSAQINVSAPLLTYFSNGSYSQRYEHLQGGDIYNAITGEVVGTVEGSESISSISFKGDVGLAIYYTDNGIWFNAIAQDGTAKFEPIKANVTDASGIKFDGETILLTYQCLKESTNTIGLGLTTYDTSGNLLGEVVVEDWSFYLGSISLNDGVIKLYDSPTKKYTLFNSALVELF